MKQLFLRRTGALLLAALLACSLAVPALAADVKSVALNQSSLTVNVDQDATLTATVTDTDDLPVTDPDIAWSSSDEEIAAVSDDGTVTGVAPGVATITATSGEQSASCTVTVPGVKLKADSLSLQKDKTGRISFDVFPAGAAVTWTSDDEDVATVDAGVVTAVGPGEATITASSGGVDAECAVTVSVLPTAVTLNETELTLAVGGTAALEATVEPEDATTKTVTWSSSNANVTVDDDGKVTAVSAGTAIVTARTTAGNRTASCRVTVTTSSVTSIYLNANTNRLEPGDTTRLTVTLSPPTSTAAVTWSVSDEKVATLSGEGETRTLTALTAGKVTVRVEAGSSVASREIEVSGVVLDQGDANKTPLSGGTFTVTQGKAQNLGYTPYGAAVGSSSIAWESSDGAVASVSGGRVTGRSVGEAEITLTIGAYSAKCKVRVVENTTGVITGNTSAGSTYPFSDIRSRLNSLCQELTGTGLNYITNLSVPTSQGILYYGYVSADDPGYGVASSTERYYYSDSVMGERGLSGITFVPNSSFSGTATITYTGYGTGKETFAGTIRLEVEGIDDVAYTTSANSAVTFSTADFNNACRSNTGRDLSYVTFELPTAARGVLYYNYSGQAIYAEKVAAGTQYFRTRSPYIDSITFVPAQDYTGTVRITYRAVDTSANSYTGRVTINITSKNVSGSGDVVYKADQGERVTFRSSDFNTACRDAIGESLDYVRFTLPSSGHGTLYYNYRSSGTYDSRVSDGTRYNRSGTPSLSNVTFVPASGAPGRVTIDFTGYGTGGDRFDGTVVIQYDDDAGDGTVPYSTRAGRAVEFNAADFNELCRDVNGASLDYIRFEDLPASSRGTLYYNYSGSSSSNTRVTESARYYRTGGSYAISRVSFVPKSGYTGTVSIGFLGYDVNGKRFEGQVRIEVEPSDRDSIVRYSVRSGGSVNLNASDFNSLCQDLEGANLSYVQFELPSATRGTLYYQSGSSSTRQKVTASSSYYRSGGSRLLDDVSFAAAANYAGSVSIPFTATTVGSQKLTGTVEIQVYEPTAETIRYTGTVFPVTIQSADFRRVCGAVLNGEFSRVQFTTLPDASSGRLCQDYSVSGGGTPVIAGASYYYNGSPSLNQISFVPRAGFQGTVTLPYTAYDADGDKITGSVVISVANSVTSRFSDMGSYSWAAPSVEYLAQNGIVSGVSSSQFGPGQAIQRCDFAVMLCRAFNLNTGSTASFADVPAGSYYAQAVATARDMGIVTGNNGRFMPNSPLSRQDAMVMLQRALTATGRSVSGGSSVSLGAYSDSGQISDYARSAVASMVQMGLVTGNGAGQLMPRSSVTRAEMAVILHRVLTQ